MRVRADRRLRTTAITLAIGCVALWAAGPAQASALPKMTLNITGSSIAVGGATQSGAVNVVTTDGLKKEASAILFQLAPGKTATELETFLKSKKSKDPNEATRYGSIAFDAEVFPGQPSEVQTELQPGEYVALAAPGHGPPKVFTSFTVSAAATPAALPKPEATIRSIEFDFRGPRTLHDGELVRFRNDGFLVHMDLGFRAKSRAAAKVLAHDLLIGKQKGMGKLLAGPPVGFQGVVSHGAFQQETIDAKPGWYVQVCFMETQEGVPHAMLGMERVIRIVK